MEPCRESQYSSNQRDIIYELLLELGNAKTRPKTIDLVPGSRRESKKKKTKKKLDFNVIDVTEIGMNGTLRPDTNKPS